LQATLAAVALALASVLSATAEVTDASPDGPQFVVRCSGDVSVTGGVTSVVCTLHVVGLPDPLDDDVNLTLVSFDQGPTTSPSQTPGGTAPVSTPPDLDAGMPVVVTRWFTPAPPPPVPLSPQVPELPPKHV
jgi:hypothetical protein